MFNSSFFTRCLRILRKNKKNHYDVLGVSRQASQREIKTAYYKLSLVHHPDKPNGSNERFLAIKAAYEVLGNSSSRRIYDAVAESDKKLEQKKPKSQKSVTMLIISLLGLIYADIYMRSKSNSSSNRKTKTKSTLEETKD